MWRKSWRNLHSFINVRISPNFSIFRSAFFAAAIWSSTFAFLLVDYLGNNATMILSLCFDTLFIMFFGKRILDWEKLPVEKWALKEDWIRIIKSKIKMHQCEYFQFFLYLKSQCWFPFDKVPYRSYLKSYYSAKLWNE